MAYTLKTRKHDGDVQAFIDGVAHERRRADAQALLAMMTRITGEEAKMWGPSIVGFGTYHYKYDSGHEGDYFLTGFSPRKQAMTVYIMPGFSEFSELTARLGKHRTAKSCLYINRLDDIDLTVLETLIADSMALMRARYPRAG